MRSPPLVPRRCPQRTLSGISPPFGGLFLTEGQVAHVLLTRSPLYSSPCGDFLARLACVRHAASVRSEPGSNSPRLYGLSMRDLGTSVLADGNGITRVSTHKLVAMIFCCQRTKRAGSKTSRRFTSRTSPRNSQGPINRGTSRHGILFILVCAEVVNYFFKKLSRKS